MVIGVICTNLAILGASHCMVWMGYHWFFLECRLRLRAKETAREIRWNHRWLPAGNPIPIWFPNMVSKNGFCYSRTLAGWWFQPNPSEKVYIVLGLWHSRWEKMFQTTNQLVMPLALLSLILKQCRVETVWMISLGGHSRDVEIRHTSRDSPQEATQSLQPGCGLNVLMGIAPTPISEVVIPFLVSRTECWYDIIWLYR